MICLEQEVRKENWISVLAECLKQVSDLEG